MSVCLQTAHGGCHVGGGQPDIGLSRERMCVYLMANLMIYFELWQRKEKNRCASGAKTLEIFKISSEFFRKTLDFFKISLEIFRKTMDLSFSCSDACEVGRAGAKSKERERQNSGA